MRKEFYSRFTEEILEAVDVGEGQGDVVPVGLELANVDPEDIWNFIEQKLIQVEKATQKYLINKIEVLIADEMLIAQKEGQPTSRLTSLAVKLKEIK